jgi:hypothetical protein
MKLEIYNFEILLPCRRQFYEVCHRSEKKVSYIRETRHSKREEVQYILGESQE